MRFRAKASESISLRLPKPMLVILKEFARREGIGYQVLIKRWLDDRIRAEHAARVSASPAQSAAILVFEQPPMILQAASFDDKCRKPYPCGSCHRDRRAVSRLGSQQVNESRTVCFHLSG